jgi:hypothetical protein
MGTSVQKIYLQSFSTTPSRQPLVFTSTLTYSASASHVVCLVLRLEAARIITHHITISIITPS